MIEFDRIKGVLRHPHWTEMNQNIIRENEQENPGLCSNAGPTGPASKASDAKIGGILFC